MFHYIISTIVLTYILTYWFYVRRCYQTLTSSFSQTSLRKLLKFCQGILVIFVKNCWRWVLMSQLSDARGWDFWWDFYLHSEKVCFVYISNSDQYQLQEIYSRIVTLPFSQLTPILPHKILKNAPALVLSQLRYWCWCWKGNLET